MTRMIEIRGLAKTFVLHLQGSAQIPVFSDLALHVDAGECLALRGPSGTGKSTLAEYLALAVSEAAEQSVAVLSIDDFYLTKAERQRLSQHQPAAKIDQSDGAQRRRKLDKGTERGHQAQGFEHRVTVAVDVLADVSGLDIFAGKGLDLADARQVVVERRVEFPQVPLALAECRSYITGKTSHPQDDERNWDQAHQHEL